MPTKLPGLGHQSGIRGKLVTRNILVVVVPTGRYVNAKEAKEMAYVKIAMPTAGK